jgi:hypothetical protein
VTGRQSPRQRPRRPLAGAGGRPGWWAIGCGLVLLLVAGGQVGRAHPVAETGAARVAQLSQEPVAVPDGGPVPVAGPGRPPAPAHQPPVALRIGAIDLTAPVVEVGVDPRTGELALPGVDRAGWYRFGPGPAATRGSIVIAGHVDSVAGPGVFFRLAELAPGDRITVTAAGGAARRFEVVGREVYRKGDLPLERYFARDGAPRLTLITCTGPFDRPAGGYRDNLVVTAVPTGQLPAGR